MALKATKTSMRTAAVSTKKVVEKQSQKKESVKETKSITFDVSPERNPAQKRLSSVAAEGESLPAVIAPDVEKKLQSMFGKKAGVIVDMLEMDDSDGALTLVSRSLLQTLVDILPIAENNVRKTDGAKGVYGFNQLVSQVREMCNDIRAHQDRGHIGQRIVEQSVRPVFVSISMQIVQAFIELDSIARVSMKETDYARFVKALDSMKTNLAQYMMSQYTEVEQQVTRSLS
jgi:hypothetical protein